MTIGDVSATVLHAIGIVVGLVAGIVGTWGARALPRRYEIDHVPSERTRKLRDGAIVVLSVVCGGALAHVAAAAREATLSVGLVWLVTHGVLASAAIAAAAIDLEHMILPHEITWGGAVLALATSHFRGLGIVASVVGAIVGLAITYLPFLLYKKLRGRSGMGLGDASLALFAGAWLGAEGVIFVVFAGAIQSALSAVVMRALGIDYGIPASVQAQLAAIRAKADAGDAEAKAALADDPMAADVSAEKGSVMSMRLPMGPFLVLACVEFLFAKKHVLAIFDSILGR